MPVLIRVTQDDIDGGHCEDQCKCPVSLAIRREIRIPTSVGSGMIIVDYQTPWQVEIWSPDEVNDFVEAFDNGEPVDPFEFELDFYPELHVSFLTRGRRPILFMRGQNEAEEFAWYEELPEGEAGSVELDGKEDGVGRSVGYAKHYLPPALFQKVRELGEIATDNDDPVSIVVFPTEQAAIDAAVRAAREFPGVTLVAW